MIRKAALVASALIATAGIAAIPVGTASAVPARYTAAQVSTHSSANDCWTIVGRGVYDVTDYVSSHPGGSGAILAMCGADATASFRRQHGSTRAAQAALKSFKIGMLKR